MKSQAVEKQKRRRAALRSGYTLNTVMEVARVWMNLKRKSYQIFQLKNLQ